MSVLVGIPFATHAAGGVYANSVYAESNGTVYKSSNAVGAPDGAYADFRDERSYVTLDMGENEKGTGDLTLTYKILENGASYQVRFYDEDMNLLQSSGDTFATYSTETTVAYAGSESYRYVRIECPENELWRLDAVAAEGIEEESADSAEPEASDNAETDTQTEVENPTVSEETSPARGMVMKLVDDGDPDTTADAAVYVIGDDGKRHAFPSETVYKSWYKSYDDIAYIDPENLAGYQLGDNVTVRPGTWLVKITTDPKVYAVEPGGVLRWITTEEIAASLYGDDWAKRVIDVPDTYWSNYTVGDAITSDEVHPDGSLGVITGGEVVYLDSDSYYTLPGDVYRYMRFVSDFYVNVTDGERENERAGGDLTNDPDIAFPY